MTSTVQILAVKEIKQEIFDDDEMGENQNEMDLGDCPLTLASTSSNGKFQAPSFGPVILTDEEIKAFQGEGLKIPTMHPLTPREREVLKIIRRKIKNKTSAQESRRKRKDYMEKLEEQTGKMEKEVKRLNAKGEQLTKRIVQLEKFLSDIDPELLKKLEEME